MRTRPSPLRIGVTAALVVLLTVTALMATGMFDAFDFLRAGRTGPSADLIRRDFGDRFEIAGSGYDGQQTYAVARTFPHVPRAEPYLDTPRYRLLRIVEPMVARPAGRGDTLVLALVGWGALGLGLLCGAVADLARRHGRNPAVGYLAAIPAIAPVLTLTVEPLAYGLAFAALCLFDRRRMAPAAVCTVAAVLTRETALVVAVGAAVGLVHQRRTKGAVRDAAILVVPALAALTTWFLVLGELVDPRWPDMTRVLGLLDVPPSRVALGVTVIAVSLLGAYWWRTTPYWPVALAFALWVLVDNPDIVEWLALPRVSIPGIALGLAGPATAAHAVRTVAADVRR
jgi:hypothetical protein